MNAMGGVWTKRDERLLLDLLGTDTVTPMETGRASRLREAQERFAESAERSGFEVARHRAAPKEALDDLQVPRTVLGRVAEMGDEFLASQPNLILRLGPTDPAARTLVFNGHLDTVGPKLAIETKASRVHGRGAVDAKGPMVAMLAGIRDALQQRPGLCERLAIVIHAVGGEEGGAMGTYGSRQVVREGWVGRLNVVVEPTRMRFMDRSTAAMTARLEVRGAGCTDDAPERGENATLLLAHLACELAKALSGPAEERRAKLCIAGLCTGTTHDRVYGRGQLLLNIAYNSLADARFLESVVEQTVPRAGRSFQRQFGKLAIAARSAARWEDIVKLDWPKRGLPVLANRDRELEQLLREAGIARNGESDCPPFTCDAIWLQHPESYTIVFGPGDLERNGAHTEREYIELDELARYATLVSALVRKFDSDGATIR